LVGRLAKDRLSWETGAGRWEIGIWDNSLYGIGKVGRLDAGVFWCLAEVSSFEDILHKHISLVGLSTLEDSFKDSCKFGMFLAYACFMPC